MTIYSQFPSIQSDAKEIFDRLDGCLKNEQIDINTPKKVNDFVLNQPILIDNKTLFGENCQSSGGEFQMGKTFHVYVFNYSNADVSFDTFGKTMYPLLDSEKIRAKEGDTIALTDDDMVMVVFPDKKRVDIIHQAIKDIGQREIYKFELQKKGSHYESLTSFQNALLR